MSTNYRVIVHYHLKNGVEEQAIHFLESELIKKGHEKGCHYIEICQSERDPSILEGIAVWSDLAEAKNFQSRWATKEKEFVTKFCKEAPKRAFYKLRHCYTEKSRKAA